MTRAGEREILVTGFGGQGIVLTGAILGKAATIHDHKHATMTQSYGPEARGGSCSSQIVISDQNILFPYVETPEVLICMSQEGFDKNLDMLPDGGLLIWDTDLVDTGGRVEKYNSFHVPATRFAEDLGNKMMANIVMLGFFSALSDVVTSGSLKKAVLSSVPPKTREKNEMAFERGTEFGRAILKSRAKQEEGREKK